jgi:AraC-like DNA-binding protein
VEGLPQGLTVATATPWRDRANRAIDPAPVSGDGFAGNAEPRIAALGPIDIVRCQGEASLTLDGPEGRLRSAVPSYTVLLQEQGATRIDHYGLASVLDAGDLVLVNHAAPHGIALASGSQLVALHVPLRLLRSYLPSPEQFCGRPLRRGDGISESAAQLILGICAQLDQGLAAEFHNRIARNLLDLLATAFSLVLDGTFGASPVICDRNARVRLYIEQNLRDPDLCPAVIAASLRLSPRYLRAIFAASKETVSAYILRRRLEECARELPDPRLQQLSITDVAFGWGFNSGPHFARSFRAHFGMSPRDHRRMGLHRSADALA